MEQLCGSSWESQVVGSIPSSLLHHSSILLPTVDASWTMRMRPHPTEGGGLRWKERNHRSALEFLLPYFDSSRHKLLCCSSHCNYGCLKNSQLEPILIIMERKDINPDLPGGSTHPVSTRWEGLEGVSAMMPRSFLTPNSPHPVSFPSGTVVLASQPLSPLSLAFAVGIYS